jgi:hypothetical protein
MVAGACEIRVSRTMLNSARRGISRAPTLVSRLSAIRMGYLLYEKVNRGLLEFAVDGGGFQPEVARTRALMRRSAC